ncbi:MAG: shikimate kinase [Vulcanimicrobiaceae bacterium]
MKEHITLIGFMAAGKSTIGRYLARELSLPFVDTDSLIVQRHGAIDEIFAREGVEKFRGYEFEAIRDVLDGPRAVVALGGGAVTHEPTRALIAERALRVYLEVPVPSLVARLRHSSTVRPVLGGTFTTERVRELLAAREPLYREAELTIHGARRSRRALARELADRINLFLQGVPA